MRLNKLNRQDWPAPQARLGIVTTGKSYLDVREALQMMGIDADTAPAIGLRLLKIGVSWPLEPQCIRAFADGLDEILVVEEKRQIIEYQLESSCTTHRRGRARALSASTTSPASKCRCRTMASCCRRTAS